MGIWHPLVSPLGVANPPCSWAHPKLVVAENCSSPISITRKTGDWLCFLHLRELQKRYRSGRRSFPFAVLCHAGLREACLPGIDLRQADLRGADLRAADLHDARLGRANLSDADLTGVNLQCADLTWADLRDCDLRGADLRSASLSGATLMGACLRGAVLQGANLADADVRRADLRGADLSAAKLCGADLSGARLGRADMRATDLTGVVLPAGLRYRQSAKILVRMAVKGSLLGGRIGMRRGVVLFGAVVGLLWALSAGMLQGTNVDFWALAVHVFWGGAIVLAVCVLAGLTAGFRIAIKWISKHLPQRREL